MPNRGLTDKLVTIRAEGDPEIQVVVMATKVLGSPELDRLVASVPWPVHVVALGARDHWASTMQPHGM